MSASCKVLLDTNVLVDAVVAERPQHAEARRLLEELMGGTALGYVCPLSLKDFFYLTHGALSDAVARGWIGLFMDVLEVVPVNRASCEAALCSENPDFEDALIEAAVQDAQADFLVSRDLEGFKTLTVPRVTAAEFLELQATGRA